MTPFIRQFRRSFKVGDVLTNGSDTLTVNYIGTELVVMTIPKYGQCVFWERVYNWRKVKA